MLTSKSELVLRDLTERIQTQMPASLRAGGGLGFCAPQYGLSLLALEAFFVRTQSDFQQFQSFFLCLFQKIYFIICFFVCTRMCA